MSVEGRRSVALDDAAIITPTRAPAGKRLSQLIATACSNEEIPEVSLDIERGAVQHGLALVAARLNQSIIAWLLSFVSSP